MAEHAGDLPSPSKILARYADVTGDPYAFANAYPDAERLMASYGLTGQGGGYAAVGLEAQYPVTTVRALFPIGQYDPSRNRWRFAEEYVPKDDHHRLGERMRTLVAAAQIEVKASHAAGHFAIDLYHKQTRFARRRTALAMQGLRQPRDWIADDSVRQALEANAAPIVKADNYLMCYPKLYRTLHTTPEGNNIMDQHRLLTLCFSGLKVAAGPLGHTRRDTRELVVATRNLDNPDEWNVEPTFPAAPAEAVILGQLPNEMLRLAASLPDYSPTFNAIAYHAER